ncbi:MAG TPA: tetratricopeptide repeat protein [Candidatus Acidoferrales bacterium]|nr:tetratricopeptide repeat protein [Candidatus Acidoferrales bacterium]
MNHRVVRLGIALAATLVLASAPVALHAQQQAKVYVDPTVDDTEINGFSSDPQGAIHAARELIAAGKMDAAIAQLQRYVADHPGEVGPRRFLGDLYFRTGQIDRAKFLYQEILLFAPNDKETHNRLGTVYAEENRIDDAIAQFNAALPGTDSVDDLVSLHIRKGDLAQYEVDVQRMAREYPNDPAIQGELGQVYYAIHQPAQAEVYYNRALSQDPRNLTALNGLGLALLEMHRYGEAILSFEQCLGIDPPAFQCQNNLGATYLEAGRFDEAKVALDKAYKDAPERGETFVNYGYLADQQDNWQGAVTQYSKAIEIDPYLREAYIDLGIDYERRQLYVLAQAVLVKGIASVYDDGRLHVLLGDAYQAQGDTSDALAQFKLGEKGSDAVAAGIASQRVSMINAASSPRPRDR